MSQLSGRGGGGGWAGREAVVLGGAGFIGSNLALRLLAVGADVSVVDGLIAGCGGSPANLERVGPPVPLIRADLARDAVPEVVLTASVIFDLLGEPAHGRSLSEPQRDLECNLLSQIHLFEAVRASGRQPLIVMAGTRQVYGTPHALPVGEDHPVAPPDPNGVHKLAADHYAAVYGRVYGIPSVVLRLTNVYGPRQGTGHPGHGVTGFLIGRLLRGEPVLLYDGGALRRDWLYVDDAVEAFLAAAEAPQAAGRVYNIGHDRATSLREFVLAARDVVGGGDVRDVPFPGEQRSIDVGDYWTDPRRAEQELKWRATTPLADGLRATIDFYRSRRGGERWPP